MTTAQKVHGTVILTGSAPQLTQVKKALADDFICHHYRDNALLIADVLASELPDLERFAASHDCSIDQVRDTHDVRIAAPSEAPENAPSIEVPEQPKQPDLSVMAGGWYKTNQEDFPLIHVIEVRNEVDPDGILLWLFDVDLVNADRMPQQATLDAQQLKSYSPKPASLDDFEDLDIAPPDGFEGAPHVIPSVEDELEETKQKTAGVSLVQAQLGAAQLQELLGLHRVHAEVLPVQRGFIVQARLHGNPPRELPRVVNGAPVHYII